MAGSATHNYAVVIGVGNQYRHDDGVGPAVAQRLRRGMPAGVAVREESGEGAALMEAWRDAPLVILIDAVRSGAAPGMIHRFDAQAEPIPANFFHYSTHAFSVAEAIELARMLDKLPARLVVYGVEGKEFAAGEGLSPEVAHAAELVARRVCEELETS